MSTGFHLTRTEFRLIREDLAPESRRFLVKQGHHAVVAELDLSSMGDALAVLSGRTATVELLDRIRAEVGDDPADWMPRFQQQRKEGHMMKTTDLSRDLGCLCRRRTSLGAGRRPGRGVRPERLRAPVRAAD